MKEEITDQELMSRVKEGNHDAFKALFRKYFARLCGFVMSIVKSQDLAVDIVQQVFTKLWEKRKSLFIDQSVNAYLITAVKNECYNQIKSIKTRIKYESNYLEEHFEAYESFYDADQTKFMNIVNEAIAQLPAKCRQVYQLAKEDGLTYGEIAEYMSISEKTVENQMGIALRKLREILKPQLSAMMG